MTTANARISIILASCLMLGLATAAQRVSAQAPAGFSQPELDQMLAPVALYPDTVLSHVLIAATYPLEVVQAARWSRANPGLEGEYAVAAVEHYPWDPSVMALVAFPELLARMDIDLDWTQRLGDAFLIQEYQVLETVQYLRDEAYASGHLRSNQYVRVVRETEYIYIEPSVTRVVYVPWYDPYTVYGNWRWSAYPPVYWHQPSGYRSGFSFHWGSGHRLQYGFFFSAVHWPSHRLMVHDHYGYYPRHDKHYGKRYGKHGYGGPRFTSGRELARYKGARHWKHDQDHRRGVAYRRGIDERHAIRASGRSDITDRNHGHNNARSAGHQRGRNDRHELLRQRARTEAVQSRRSASRSVESNQRTRKTQARTRPGRNSIRRESNSAVDVTTTSSGKRKHGSTARSAGKRSSTSERGRLIPKSAASRQALAQRRASAAAPQTRSSSGDTRSHRSRARQSQSSIRQSTSRSAAKSAPRSSSRSRSADARRAVHSAVRSQSRQPADSIRSAARSSGKALSPKASPRAEKRAKQAGTASRSRRAAATRQAQSSERRSRAEVLRSRGRDRRQ